MNKQGVWMGRAVVLGLLLMSALWINQGCTAKAPAAPVFAIPPPVGLANNIIDNFEDGNTSMSVDLKGAASLPQTVISYVPSDPQDPNSPLVAQGVVNPPVPLGSWVGSSWAGNAVNTPYIFTGASTSPAPSNLILSSGALGTKGYCRLFGPIHDAADGTYPAFQLEGKFKGTAPYDASSFTGIQFYLNIPTADTCPTRRFSIATIWTLPAAEGGNGYCTSCYDHYGANFAAGSTGGWVLRSYTFTTLSRGGFLVPAGIPNNMPLTMRTDFVKLVFQFGRNGTSGNSVVDYAVDEFSFF